jgi:hypothetical protein
VPADRTTTLVPAVAAGPAKDSWISAVPILGDNVPHAP